MNPIDNLAQRMRDKSKYTPMPKRVVERELASGEQALKKLYQTNNINDVPKEARRRLVEKIRREASQGHYWIKK